MFQDIKKWLCRRWTGWVHFEYKSNDSTTVHHYQQVELLKRVSNDGLTQYKKVKVW